MPGNAVGSADLTQAMRDTLNMQPTGMEPTGTLAVTVPRLSCYTSITNTSGTLRLQGVYLPTGFVFSNVLVQAAAAGATLTHSWAGLYSTTPAQLAVSLDNTGATWAIDAVRTFAMTTPYTVTAGGFFYVGVMQAGTTPANYYAFNLGGAGLAASAPVLGGTSSTGLTTPVSTVVAPTAATSMCHFRIT